MANEEYDIEELCEGAPDWVSDTLRKGLEDRAIAKGYEDKAKEIKDAANEGIQAALEFLKVDKVSSALGSVALVHSERKTYDIQVAGQYLVEHGVSAKVVSNAMTAAEKVTVSDSVKFTLPRVNGKSKKKR